MYFKMRIEHFTDQLIYETFFEKVFMMMEQPESIRSNCLHILTPCFSLFHNKHKMTMYRLSSPAEILIRDTHYRNRILKFSDIFTPGSLVEKDYDTVVKTINLIEEGLNNYRAIDLFIGDHVVTEMHIAFQSKINQIEVEVDWNEINSFENRVDRISINDAPYLYFYLEAYSQQRGLSNKSFFHETALNLHLLERIKQFDFSIISNFCQEISNIKRGEEYKVPLYLRIVRLLLMNLGDFVNNIKILYEMSNLETLEGEDHPIFEDLDMGLRSIMRDSTPALLLKSEYCLKIDLYREIIPNLVKALQNIVLNFTANSRVRDCLLNLNSVSSSEKNVIYERGSRKKTRSLCKIDPNFLDEAFNRFPFA